MRKLSRRGRAVLAVAILGAVTVNAGAAWAYWQHSGSGTASGAAGSVIALQASGTPVNGALLYPGVRRNLRITVTNSNSFAVRITQIRHAATPTIVDSAHAANGCVNSGVRLTAVLYSVTRVVPRNGTTSFDLANAITMTNESDSACQGASFTVPILVTGAAQPA